MNEEGLYTCREETALEGTAPEEGTAEMAAEYGDDLQKLAEEYPGEEELPEEVAAAILEGEAPSAAYLKYENRMLKAMIAGEVRDRENRERAFGSALGSAEGEERDPFLSGFDAAFKD